MTRRRVLRVAAAALVLASAGAWGGPLAAQNLPPLRLVGPAGAEIAVPVSAHRGYHAVPVSALEGLGWSVEPAGDAWRLRHGSDLGIRLEVGTPYFLWGEDLLQLVDPPYRFANELYVPLQLLTDFLPARVPRVYALDVGPGAPTVRVLDEAHWRGGRTRGAAPAASPPAAPETASTPPPRDPPPSTAPLPSDPRRPSAGAASRVVVIDPGHGGRDPGASGPGGTREKDVALALGRALARELRRYPGIEVHLTRDSDVLVPLWKRGEWATQRKGERPGLFISLHANALGSNRSARGFETYFLSEARNEHERRVAALENAAVEIERAEDAPHDDPHMSFILKELRTFDHQHWSSFLAETIQDQVSAVHPGPNRGVKQGPFAVITNALMPAVLVEVGFISNREEERLLARSAFHTETARALGRAIVEFFERYPPGQGAKLVPAVAVMDAGGGSGAHR